MYYDCIENYYDFYPTSKKSIVKFIHSNSDTDEIIFLMHLDKENLIKFCNDIILYVKKTNSSSEILKIIKKKIKNAEKYHRVCIKNNIEKPIFNYVREVLGEEEALKLKEKFSYGITGKDYYEYECYNKNNSIKFEYKDYTMKNILSESIENVLKRLDTICGELYEEEEEKYYINNIEKTSYYEDMINTKDTLNRFLFASQMVISSVAAIKKIQDIRKILRKNLVLI